MAQFDVNFSATLSDALSPIGQGFGVCPVSPGATAYVIATATNRAALGRAGGLCITNSTPAGTILVQYSGEVSPDITNLGPGAIAAVRLAADGSLQRVTGGPPSLGDYIMGDCDAAGGLTLMSNSRVNPFIGSGLSAVTGTAPIVSSGGIAPNISINAATDSTAGSMSATDKTKLDNIGAGALVVSVTGAGAISSTGGANPVISIVAATDSVPGSMSASDKTKLDGITGGAAVASVGGTAPIVSSGGTTPVISITAATESVAGSMSATDKTKLDGMTAGAAVASVSGTAPIVSSGGTTPAISINAATESTAGSLSAVDKTKLDGITSGAAVASVSGTAPIVSSGGTTPAISIVAATESVPGSMSAADKTKLDGITSGAAVASVSGTAPITSSGGTTPAIGIVAATQSVNGYLSFGDKIKLDNLGGGISSGRFATPVVAARYFDTTLAYELLWNGGEWVIATGCPIGSLGSNSWAGLGNTALGQQATAFGGGCTANGGQSSAMGSLSDASGKSSRAGGERAVASREGQDAWASGSFGTGDSAKSLAQDSRMVLRGNVTGEGVSVELAAGSGPGQYFTLEVNKAYVVQYRCVAYIDAIVTGKTVASWVGDFTCIYTDAPSVVLNIGSQVANLPLDLTLVVAISGTRISFTVGNPGADHSSVIFAVCTILFTETLVSA